MHYLLLQDYSLSRIELTAGKRFDCSGIKGCITSIANEIKTILEIVPIPGVSLRGIQRKRTKTPTINVDKPTVKFVCSDIPWARTVHVDLLRFLPIKMASPVPKIHSPETRARIVNNLGLEALRGRSELQMV